MNFMDAPSPTHQINVIYNGRPMLQGLDTVRGPMLFPNNRLSENRCANRYPSSRYPYGFGGLPPLVYPITHSYPSPYQQSFIMLAGKSRNPGC